MLHLRILTTDKAVFDSTADEILLPTESGVIGVLAHHSPLVSIVKPGQMTVKKEGETLTFFIASGILEVRPGSQVVILASAAQQASDIDLVSAKHTLELAQNALEAAQKASEPTEHLQRNFTIASARVRVAENYQST